MLAHHSLFVFVIGIYGHSARIYRFDHAGVIALQSFNYVTHPHIMGQFYWRLVHPIVPSTASIHDKFIVGSDTTMTPVPHDDLFKIFPYLMPLKIPAVPLFNAAKCGHYIQARLGGCDAPLRTFLTLGDLYRSTGLFSRATTVWKVVPLPLPENPDEPPQIQ
jgi:hypothetical protein